MHVIDRYAWIQHDYEHHAPTLRRPERKEDEKTLDKTHDARRDVSVKRDDAGSREAGMQSLTDASVVRAMRARVRSIATRARRRCD